MDHDLLMVRNRATSMNVVATVLLTKPDNPMCPGCDNYTPDVKILEKWIKSIHGDCRAVVLHDELSYQHTMRGMEWSRVPIKFLQVSSDDSNLFFQRWALLREWLVWVLDVDKVFMTDGSDVVMLNPPWDEMKPEQIYCGSENDVVSNKWIVANHPTIKPYAELRPHATLLNAGLLGGSRSVMLRFLGDFLSYAPDSLEDMTDMGAFNRCVWHFWNDCYVTGPQVHTVFNKWERTGTSWFAHK